eukprot:268009-Rhodomonas_salina.1
MCIRDRRVRVSEAGIAAREEEEEGREGQRAPHLADLLHALALLHACHTHTHHTHTTLSTAAVIPTSLRADWYPTAPRSIGGQYPDEEVVGGERARGALVAAPPRTCAVTPRSCSGSVASR